MNWIEILILGVVQGVTEFLPISSDGHLTVFQMLFGMTSGKENLFLDVMLHVGTTLAIVLHYRHAVLAGARGLLGSVEVPEVYRRSSVVRVGWLVFIACLPLAPYAKGKKYLEAAMESPVVTGIGFLVTAAALIVTIRRQGGDKGPSETTWRDVLLIGIAQAFAPLPGVSRSGLTIATALARGFSRTWAVRFSLLIAVPAVAGATLFELKDIDLRTLTADRVGPIVAATVLAGLVGYAAIVWLVRIVRAGGLWYFSVYLVVLAAVVLAGSMMRGPRTDVRESPTPDRSERAEPLRSGPDPGDSRLLDRALGPGARSGHARPGAPSAGDRGSIGLDLG